jgi:hypothetical protein
MKKNKNEEEEILQNLNEENLTSVEIIFKRSQITETLRILFTLLEENYSEINKKKINLNKNLIEIYTYRYDKIENTTNIEGFDIYLKIEKFIKSIKDNLKEDNSIEIVLEELYPYISVSTTNI